MFRAPDLSKPQPAWKRPLYLTSTTVLGFLLSILAHAIIETWYLAQAETRHWTVHWTSLYRNGLCALSVWAQVVLPLVGIVGGLLVGRLWWRLVYVEGRWSRWHRT